MSSVSGDPDEQVRASTVGRTAFREKLAYFPDTKPFTFLRAATCAVSIGNCVGSVRLQLTPGCVCKKPQPLFRIKKRVLTLRRPPVDNSVQNLFAIGSVCEFVQKFHRSQFCCVVKVSYKQRLAIFRNNSRWPWSPIQLECEMWTCFCNWLSKLTDDPRISLLSRLKLCLRATAGRRWGDPRVGAEPSHRRDAGA